MNTHTRYVQEHIFPENQAEVEQLPGRLSKIDLPVVSCEVLSWGSVLRFATGQKASIGYKRGYRRAWVWTIPFHAAYEFEPLSAGIEPKKLHPFAVEVMREVGIDISHQKSKSVVHFLGQRVSYVVTVCDDATERCPKFPGTIKLLQWSLDDPAEGRGTYQERLAAFRRVRDELAANIRQEFTHIRAAVAA